MRTIWKYVFDKPGDLITPELLLPKVVHFALDPESGFPAVWVEHHQQSGDIITFGEPPRRVRMTIVGTGWDIPDGLTHGGTLMDIPFVWHLYGRVEP